MQVYRAIALPLALAALASCGGEKEAVSPQVQLPISTPTSNQPATPTPTPTPTPTVSANQITSHSYPKTEGPDKNPLKGWNSSWWNDYPESSVGFQYVSWEKFEPQDDQFDFAAMEGIIDRPGSRGRHLVLRLYCDWDGRSANSDCPDWIYTTGGVANLQGANGRYVTDYNDPDYVTQVSAAIRAFANKYKNDPRIYAIQIGILGYWGEWHNGGSSFNGRSYDASPATRDAILSTTKASWTGKALMGRYPWDEPLASTGGIGFHNDFFVPNNDHSDKFDQTVTAGNKWEQGPVGGEVPPRSDSEAASERNALFNTPKGLSMIETGHYATMAPGKYRQVSGDSDFADYMMLHRRMGYNYQISEVKFADTAARSLPYAITLAGKNIGIAAMYYDWDVEFALLDANGNIVVKAAAATDLRAIKAGNSFEFSAQLAFGAGVAAGKYRLVTRIVQPGAGDARPERWKLDASNTYIRFANTLPVIDGAWGADNALTGGWSVLGDITLTAN